MIPNSKRQSGFTLIELLVVIAIIGILSSVVFASISSSRVKARDTSIVANLRNIIPAAEMAQDATGNYSTACVAGTKMISAIQGKGASVSCFTNDDAGLTTLYIRWGASALLYNAAPPIKAWSASQSGQVVWDAKGVNSSGVFVGGDVAMDWSSANTACALAGGRLPTMEELYSLTQATYLVAGTYVPPGFAEGYYWTSNTTTYDSTMAYFVATSFDGISDSYKSSSNYVHCVR
jgi:prepilin-type N-terminal cleavage/methylation domain-containing protein